jgi:hypothetical protein
MIGECPDTVTDCRVISVACVTNAGVVVVLCIIPVDLAEGTFETAGGIDDLVTATNDV